MPGRLGRDASARVCRASIKEALGRQLKRLLGNRKPSTFSVQAPNFRGEYHSPFCARFSRAWIHLTKIVIAEGKLVIALVNC